MPVEKGFTELRPDVLGYATIPQESVEALGCIFLSVPK